MHILEIGTGCGYQAAVLGQIVQQVHSVEAIEPLADGARERLHALDCYNIEVHTGNGRRGWPADAPYDGLIMTAAAEAIPPALEAQLVPGGRLILLLRTDFGVQELCLITKDRDGSLSRRSLLPVAFVPLLGA